MTFAAAFEKSGNWAVACSELVTGIPYAQPPRLRVAQRLYYMCIEQHQAIHHLVAYDLRGSAFALIRLQYEVYVRGLWMHWFASDEQATAFLADEQLKEVWKLLLDLKTVNDFNADALIIAKKKVWKAFNDFAHGGPIQVKATNIGGEASGGFNDEHTRDILITSAALSMNAAVSIVLVAGNIELSNKIQQRFNEIYPSHLSLTTQA